MFASSVTKHAERARRARSALFALACVVGAGAGADDGAQEWLRAMHEATRRLNYDGVFVYQRGTQLDSMRLVHKYAESGEQERLISLSGPAREVLRDGSHVTCLFADDQAATVEKNAPRDLIGIGFTAPLDKLLGSYRFDIEGQDRVAGRAATVIGVTPLAADRYAYKLWIDDAAKLLVKSVIIDQHGGVLEQVQFTSISILDDVPAALLEPEIAGSGFAWRTAQEQPQEPAGAPGWQAAWIPTGFELQDSKVQRMATSRMPVSHMVYSDGLAMFSVFVEAMPEGEQALQGYSSRGAVNTFSRKDGEHQITVVGEVPLQTVSRIAAAVTKR